MLLQALAEVGFMASFVSKMLAPLMASSTP